MDELFLMSELGNVPIEKSVAEKYNLKKGMKSPFSGSMIVDKNSDSTKEPPKKKSVLENIKPNKPEVALTTAEMLDFASGADS